MTPIHLRLKELRQRQRLTQQELAELADVAQSTIARIETGSLTNVTLDLIERLADALGVDATALLYHRPSKRK